MNSNSELRTISWILRVPFLTFLRVPLVSWSSLLISLLTFTRLPGISYISLLISVLSHTVLYFSSPDNGETDGCTFLWKIENLSDCWLKNGACIRSPAFTACSLHGIKWSLRLSPKGVKQDNSVTVFLKRERSYFGPDVIQVKCQISFLDKDGSILVRKPMWKGDIETEESVYFPIWERPKTVPGSERKSPFLQDTLKIQCKIWKTEEMPIMPELLSARTIFKVHRRPFTWKINKFSTFKTSSERKYVVIDSLTYDLIDFKLVLGQGPGSEKKLDIHIHSFNECINFLSFKASIIDLEGKRVNCGNRDYLDNDLKKRVSFTLFSDTYMLTNKSPYLPNDVLHLDCEYVFTAVTSSYECAKCGIISASVPQQIVKNKSENHGKREEAKLTPALVNDLKSMYSNAILSDIKLLTFAQTFPAHKSILSVRSTVFRRMFSSDMTEKKSGHVDIPDLEDDTVHRMLTYMYTDSLGDLQLESASRLYTAADKYGISSLKQKCSSFLIDNLCPTSACDVLVLADLHQDDDLKSAVQNYILEKDKEIFDTKEWEHFMASNLQLAADVMYRKVSLARS